LTVGRFNNQGKGIGTKCTATEFCYNDEYAKQAEKQEGDVHKSRKFASSPKNNWCDRDRDILKGWSN